MFPTLDVVARAIGNQTAPIFIFIWLFKMASRLIFSAKRMKLLLISPSVLLKKRLGAMLASLDSAEVGIASTMEDVTRIVRTFRPEIVVLHASLPDGEGLETLARVKSECTSACIIVVSDCFSEVYRKRWHLAGADYCFDILLQVDQMLNTVMQLDIATAHTASPPIYEHQ